MKPVLYLLPGLLCDETVWRAQVAHFADSHDVRVPDYHWINSITGMAKSVLATAPDSYSLAGHSMGARVALELLRLAPERVTRLCLLDTGVHSVKPAEFEKRMSLVTLAREKGMGALCDAWLPPMVHPDMRDDTAAMAPLREMVSRQTPERFAAQIEALLGRPETGPALEAAQCPTLVGVGRQDEWSPVAQHKDLIEKLGHGELDIYENAGHMAPYEAPDAVNQSLERWLSGPGRAL